MLITKKRIRKASKYLSHISEGTKVYTGIAITDDVVDKLKEIGFETLNHGESLVPSPELGPVNRFNANGKSIPQKDKPKETAYRTAYWELTDWGGKRHSGTSSIPYQTYPKVWIPSPWVSLTIRQLGDKKFLISGSTITVGETDEIDMTHQINLLLELFKRAEILQENLEQYELPKVIHLGWSILPEGDMPWERFKSYLSPVMEKMSKGKTIVIEDRLDTISKYNPDFRAVGKNGYRGYIIFGFKSQNLYIFESAEYGNATYVFEGNWEQLSKMTKAEIMNGKLHKHRFVHLSGWKNQIHELFEKQDGMKIS